MTTTISLSVLEDTSFEVSVRVEEDVTITPLSSETEHETFASLGYSMCLPIDLYGLLIALILDNEHIINPSVIEFD